MSEKRMIRDLMGRNIVVYDLEIKKVIDGKDIGWKSFSSMGISVGCAFDYRDYRFRVFMDDNINELAERLNEPGTLVVAFNHISFDNMLLRGCPEVKVKLNPDEIICNYDMLVESRKACGANMFTKGFKLDDHLETMKMDMKTANGAMAPIWWQEGKIGKVVDYCLNDVRVEKALFDRIYTTGLLASKHNTTPYKVADPLEILQRLES